jgi:hypothetical protein
MRDEFDFLCPVIPRRRNNRSAIVFYRRINGNPECHAAIVQVMTDARIHTTQAVTSTLVFRGL